MRAFYLGLLLVLCAWNLACDRCADGEVFSRGRCVRPCNGDLDCGREACVNGECTPGVAPTPTDGGGGTSSSSGGTNADIIIPAGAVMAYAGTTAPPGWLLCDGRPVARATYPRLFAAIGTAHGSDGDSTFNLPDYRGRFLRGVDQAAGRDPDAPTRTSMAVGGFAGDAVGSVQGDALQSHLHEDPGHSHAVTDPGHVHAVPLGITAGYLGGSAGGADPSNGPVASAAATTGITLASTPAGLGAPATPTRTAAETRPANAAVHWIIKQ